MKDEIKNLIIIAVREAGFDLPVGFDVSDPPREEMGDFATNVALLIAGKVGQNPKNVAEKISGKLTGEIISKVETASPGFINIFLKNEYLLQKFRTILEEGNEYGSNKTVKKTFNVEFISANPTGPIHIGNARGGPIGEALSNLLEFNGNKVIRSFYVNDIGGQIDKLAESFYYWYEKLNGEEPIFPEGGYPGDYVKEISEAVSAKYKNELGELKEKDEFIAFFKDKGVKAMIDRIKKEAKLLDIEYDDWIFQSELENGGKTSEVINLLKNSKNTVEREGALWFKNDKDPNFQDGESVLQKSDSNKTLTYFADDIACHKYKIDQGADFMIDLLGPGHHGHILRMKASMRAIGVDPERLIMLMYQNVRVKNGDEIIKMSKREGNFVLLADVIKYGVGPDVFKYFVLSQNNNTPFDFDVKLAMDKTEKNPIYYIQYAYARICSIIKKVEINKKDIEQAKIELLSHPREKALIKELLRFPDIVEEASRSYQLQALPHYAHKLASLFHEFYNDCRVVGETKELETARLALILSVKIVIKNVLKICDISAPEKM